MADTIHMYVEAISAEIQRRREVKSHLATNTTIHKHGQSGGLCVLKPQPRMVVPTLSEDVSWAPVPFEKILRLLTFFVQSLYQNQLISSQYKLATRVPQGCIAWVSSQKPFFSVYPPAVESRSTMLKNFMFFETDHVEKTLNSILSQDIFKAVVVVGPESRAVLQMARKWLKPRDGPAVCRVPELQANDSEKLFIYAQEAPQVVASAYARPTGFMRC